MNPLLAFLASLTLLLPGATGESPQSETVSLSPTAQGELPASSSADPSAWPAFSEDVLRPVAQQVRIEQRVIVRIAPRNRPYSTDFLTQLPRVERPTRFLEREVGNCVPVGGIAGVQADAGDRLLFFMRDRRILSANLEKKCQARDFYSGFYLERNRDGMLCVDRDKLQSRSGAKCEISRMSQLVRVDD